MSNSENFQALLYKLEDFQGAWIFVSKFKDFQRFSSFVYEPWLSYKFEAKYIDFIRNRYSSHQF
jgi:hypothetical protein